MDIALVSWERRDVIGQRGGRRKKKKKREDEGGREKKKTGRVWTTRSVSP